ncbi:MAG: sigma-54 dependent transcriptional regulator [Pseudomonadota bacterium]
MANVLIIDDDKQICKMLTLMLDRMGHTAESAHTLSDGWKAALERKFDSVLLDVCLPDGSGITLLPEIRKIANAPEVIIMTGFGDPDGAEIAITHGAWDYIQKDSSPKKIVLSIQRLIQYCENVKRARTPYVTLRMEEIVGESPAIKECFHSMAQAASSDITVLITGETGTGKELFARAIHENSSRRDRTFVVVDCAALPETLVESILFGNVKGAFTSADQSRHGLVQQADKGVLFLDEVGELPMSMQKAFLRVLQEHRYRPIGSNKEIDCDFRVIAATNRDLDALTGAGQFRSDLLFRLKSLSLHLPPLRSRPEDIRPLTMFHLSKIFARCRSGTKGISPDFYEVLMDYNWPGNVRELVNALETAVVASGPEDMLFPKHLPRQIRVYAARSAVSAPVTTIRKPDASDPLPPLKEFRKMAVREAESLYLQRLIEASAGDMDAACRISQVKRSRLYSLIKEYNFSEPR